MWLHIKLWQALNHTGILLSKVQAGEKDFGKDFIFRVGIKEYSNPHRSHSRPPQLAAVTLHLAPLGKHRKKKNERSGHSLGTALGWDLLVSKQLLT